MTATTPQLDFQKAHRQAKNRESFLETLESIVVAFVLAFVFRAFVVEAFVIPTGSMGPTLYGAHYELKCPDCGYPFAVGADSRLEVTPLCPNCFLPLKEAYAAHAEDKTPDFSGDRILVLKFVYDFQEPQRWDVIVFRYPFDPATNFIKRLVALPGESVEIKDGNVWINDEIATKTDKAQEALWQIVHDTRYRATRKGWEPRWIADKDWEARDSGFVLGKPLEGAKPSWLIYRHRDDAGRLANIRDFCSYNCGGTQATNVVTDLSLKASVTAAQVQSVIVVELRAWKDRFRFELTAQGSDQPTRILMNDQVLSQSTGGGVLPVGKAVEIEAANVDHKLMLKVGGRRVTVTRMSL
jgi:signal peptidase I